MSDTEKAPKTGRMFNTNWFDPGWHKGDMGAGSQGREEVKGETAGKGAAWAAIFNFGTEECPGRVFISKFEPGAVIHTHDHPNDYCSIVVEGSLSMQRGGQTYKVGDIRFVKAETMYGPIVMGPEGCTMIEFHPGPHEPCFNPLARQVFTAPWIGNTD